MLRVPAAEEVPALPRGHHLVEVDPRRDELVAGGRRLGHHLPHRVHDARAADQLHAVLDAGLGDADHEEVVLVGARAQAQLVQIEGQRRERRVVADQHDLGAQQAEAAVGLGEAPVLADRDADLGPRGVEDLVAAIARLEEVGLVDLRVPVRLLRARQMDLPERPRELAGLVGQERGVEVAALVLLAEAHVAGDARLPRPLEQRGQRLGRHLGLEELVEVVAHPLGEVGRQRHLRIGEDLDVLRDGLVEQAEHALDDLLAARPFVVGAHLRGGDLDVACHGIFSFRDYIRHRGRLRKSASISISTARHCSAAGDLARKADPAAVQRRRPRGPGA